MVSLTVAPGTTVLGPAKLQLIAAATSSDATIASVAFWNGSKKLATITGTSFQYNWNNVAVGTYSVTAVATDSLGLLSAPSAPVAITVLQDQKPVVSMTAVPAAGFANIGPETIELTAAVTSSDEPVASVAFFANGTKVGTGKAPLYTFAWTKVGPANYSIYAVATDSLGTTGQSAAVSLTVIADQAPSVSITAPAGGSTAVGLTTIDLIASATSTDEPIKSVVFNQVVGSANTKIGTATFEPTQNAYEYAWKKVPVGSYTLNAVATDNLGIPTQSAPINVTVVPDQAPTVAFITPLSGATYSTPASIGLSATATSPDVAITSVTYYQGGTNKLSTQTAAPYLYLWKPGAAGSYTLTAVATDSVGDLSTASTPVTVKVTSVTTSTVKLTAPTTGSVAAAPASVTMTATATAPAGVANVEFYAGNSLLGTATSSPYKFTGQIAQAGVYYLTAVETDTAGGSLTSAPISFRVDMPPAVQITTPSSGSAFIVPALINITASATPSGQVAKVEFFENSTLLGTSTKAPFQYQWTAVPLGSYSLTAQVFDIYGISSFSPAVTIQVVTEQPPAISLSTPTGGLTFGSASNVSLAFNATASTSIAKVQIYRNGALITTLTSPSSGSTWIFTEASPLPVGQYSYFARAFDSTGASTDSAPVTVTVAPNLPFVTDFEPGDGFALGPMGGQGGWSVTQGAANVSSTAYSGSQGIQLAAGSPAAIAQEVFAASPNETIIFCDFYALPAAEISVASSTIFTAEQAQFGFQQSNGQGVLQVYQGNGSGGGTWVATNFSIPLNASNQAQNWVRLTARLDFTRQTWDIYANGNMVAYDIPFVSNASTSFSAFTAQGDAAADSFFDDMYFGADNPLFNDANNDGIDDGWEALYGLSLAANDRYLNLSGDGVPVIQDFVKNVSPFINTKVLPVPVQSGLQLHLRADAAVVSSNGSISMWLDQSGQGNNAYQTQGNLQPSLIPNALNGLPAVTFLGTGPDEFLWIPPFLVGTQSAEILAVVRVDSNPEMFNTMWQFGTGFGSGYFDDSRYDDFGTADTNFYPAQPVSETSQFYFYNVSVQANDWIERFNGVQITERTGDTVSFSSFPSFGAMKGAIAEMIIYNRVLTTQERGTVNSYLMAKYAPPGISVPPTPSNLTAVTSGPTSIVLNWAGVPVDMHTTASIQRESGTTGGFSEVGEANDVSTFTDTTAVAGQTYTYQVNLFDLAGASAFSNQVTVTTPLTSGPLPPNGLLLWLKADVGAPGSGPVSSWTDQSGNGNNAVQSAPSLQPQVLANQVNGYPTVSFNGTNFLNLPPNMMQNYQAGEIIAVVELGINPSYSMLFNFGTGFGSSYYNNFFHYDDFGTGDTESVVEPASEISQHFVYDSSFDSAVGNGTSIYRYNGYPEWTRTGLDSTTTIGFSPAPDLGGYGGGSLVGDIAEVIVYNRVLTDQERETVNEYLTTKYAPPAIIVPPTPVLNAASVLPTSVILSWGVPAALHTVATIEREDGTSGVFNQVGEVSDSSIFADTSVVGGQTYTYQVTLTGLAGASATSNMASTATPTAAPPVPLSGLQLWLRADAGTQGVGPLSAWIDLSGNGNSAVQSDIPSQPQVVADQANGLPIVRFNGSQFLNLPNLMQTAQAGEIIAVAKLAIQPEGEFNGLWSFGTSGYGTAFFGLSHYDDFGTNDASSVIDTTSVTQYFIYNSSLGGGAWNYLYNGISTWSRSGDAIAFSETPEIGGSFTGDFAEILVYNRVLTGLERQAICGYLAVKYAPAGIPVPSTPTNLSAVNSVPNGITLTWEGALPGVSTTATIYRENGTTGVFAQVGQVANEDNFTDTGLTAGQSYTYEVSVASFSGSSGNSAPLSVTFGAPFGTPEDPSEPEPLVPIPGDTTPPVITLIQPADAIPQN